MRNLCVLPGHSKDILKNHYGQYLHSFYEIVDIDDIGRFSVRVGFQVVSCNQFEIKILKPEVVWLELPPSSILF